MKSFGPTDEELSFRHEQGAKRVIDIDLVIEADRAEIVIQDSRALLKERGLPAATITVRPADTEETKAYNTLQYTFPDARVAHQEM